MDPRIRSVGKLTIKVLFSAVALYLVFQKIDSDLLLDTVASARPVWLLAALVAYNSSKIISSFRLSCYFRGNHILIREKNNLRLYYLGMFYNLFMPGGIGGDAYKIWQIHRDIGTPVKSVFQSVLFDRLSGMFLLCAMGLLFGWWAVPEASNRYLLLVGAVAIFPFLYALHFFLGKNFLPELWTTTWLSAAVQGLQVVCAWAIMQSLGVIDHTAAYLTVFLFSSLVSILPISIGGIGIRELVFITAAGFSPISKDASVAFSLVFFAVTATSSLPGGFLAPPKLTESMPTGK